jgi:hypothetical protein
MNTRAAFSSAVARVGALAALCAASVVVPFALVLTLRALGIVGDPDSGNAQQTLREFVIRGILLSFVAFSYGAMLWDNQTRDWILAQRWRVRMLILYALGSAVALADPSHPIASEYNWIRYATAGALAWAGVLAITSAVQRAYPPLDRIFGAAFGLLLIAASADELFQFHERTSELFAPIAPGQGSDSLTLIVAMAGIVALAALVLLRQLGGPLGEFVRQPRLRVPLGLFAVATISLMAAMTLDSYDVYLEIAIDFVVATVADGPIAADDRLWLALTDVRQLANSVEELLELLSSVALLMMIGSLYSIRALGWAPAASES